MVKCPHKDCSNSNKEFLSDSTMRQHHTYVHNEQLPNSECESCGDKFFRRCGGTYCDDCKGSYKRKARVYKGENHPRYKGKTDYIENIKNSATCSEKDCNESRPAALCFHHKPEYEKLGNISRMAITAEYGLEELKEEVQKCEVICDNCHRDWHANTEQETHTINWDEYTEMDREIDGYRVFRNEDYKKCILRNCEFCGQECLVRVDSYNRGNGKFCSLSCASKSKVDKNTRTGLVKTLRREGECSKLNCSESRPHCLQFHHLKPEDKDENIQQIVDYGTIKKLKSELKKCELLCGNCHKVEHSS